MTVRLAHCPLSRHCLHRIDDRLIPDAAAVVAQQVRPDLLAVGHAALRQQFLPVRPSRSRGKYTSEVRSTTVSRTSSSPLTVSEIARKCEVMARFPRISAYRFSITVDSGRGGGGHGGTVLIQFLDPHPRPLPTRAGQSHLAAALTSP